MYRVARDADSYAVVDANQVYVGVRYKSGKGVGGMDWASLKKNRCDVVT